MAYNIKSTNPIVAQKMIDTLLGNWYPISALPSNLNKLGVCKGRLIGGNLSILCSLLGSLTLKDWSQSKWILIIEDIDEYLYHLERMIYMLDRSGVLKNLQGIIIGQLTNLKDNEDPFGKTAHGLISDILNKYNYPIAFNFPIGHTHENHAIVIGAEIRLTVTKQESTINYIK